MSDTTTVDPLAEALASYRELLAGAQSVTLATLDSDGQPNASYAPAIRGDDGAWWVFLSELARHTNNLRTQPRASLMVIEDEATAGHLFARRRVTFDCQVEVVDRADPRWTPAIDRMEAELDAVIKRLRQMGDFLLFRLQPVAGNLVVGFGQAYELTGENFDQLRHRTGFGGHGHRPTGHSPAKN